MRWDGQAINVEQRDSLSGLAKLSNVVRSVQTPEFSGITFHEVLAKTALNSVPTTSGMPFGWTINPYRGCSHSCVYCFARATHSYLDLDAGADFDTEIIVKINVAEVVAKELGRPSWRRHQVALGTNTDPYQRAEGRYRLMPGVIAALAESGTPLSILTKGTLLRRDLPLLAEASRLVPVDLAMSVAIMDDDLQQSMEPGTPTAKARLATVTAVREAGLDCSVFLMPVLPYLTDSRAALDESLRQIREAGATSVVYSALHLKAGTREWYLAWVAREHPELLEQYLAMYARGAYAPKEYRTWLAARIAPLIRRHGLRRDVEAPATGGVRSSAPGTRERALGTLRDEHDGRAPTALVPSSLIAEELPPSSAARALTQPTLF